MDLVLHVAIYVVVTEYILILILLIVTYVIAFFTYRIRRKKARLTLEFTSFLSGLISKNEALGLTVLPEQWQRLDIIVPVLDRFTKLITDEEWKEQRYQLIRTVLLPLAREAATSSDWLLRFYAAVCFGLVHDEQDESIIVDLTKDENPLISLNALIAAINYGSQIAIDSIIRIMAQESWLTQSMYLQLFEGAPPNTCGFVIEKIKTTDSASVKATCYAILLRFSPTQINWDINNDINSSDMCLKLSAVRFYAHVVGHEAIPLIKTLLTHKDWQARVVAIQLLSQLQAQESKSDIEGYLNDDNTWVRLYAKAALKSFELEQYPFLKREHVNEEIVIFNISLQVLDTY